MPDLFPSFRKPPVSETVIGFQFSPAEGFSTAHAGRFWVELGEEWPKAEDAPRLTDQFERFDDERNWARPGFQVSVASEPNRTVIGRRDEERLIQIQNTRFIYNWRRRIGPYPTYAVLLPEFKERYEQFRAWMSRTGFGSLALNQWEITYVNQITQGDLWQALDDWKDLVPGFFIPGGNLPNLKFDGFGGQWQLLIAGTRGRLHVSLQHGKVMVPGQNSELLALQLTARGPIDEKTDIDPWSGLDLGHEAIVRCFVGMTAKAAHESWEREG